MNKHIDLPGEEWRDIEGAPGYSVSNMGRVKGRRGYVIKTQPNGNGYPSVYLSSSEKHRRALHSIVLKAFSGPREAGMETRHIDGDKSNAKLSNLVWGTAKQNSADRISHGMQAFGEASPTAKLTWEQVKAIREAYDIRRKGRNWGVAKFAHEFAQKFSVSHYTIRKIVRRDAWAKDAPSTAELLETSLPIPTKGNGDTDKGEAQ